MLVSSKGETALTEVIGKLPEGIRPLAVGLLSSEREGMKQFEHSIQTIASTVTALNHSVPPERSPDWKIRSTAFTRKSPRSIPR